MLMTTTTTMLHMIAMAMATMSLISRLNSSVLRSFGEQRAAERKMRSDPGTD